MNSPHRTINRSVVIVRPKQPLVEWIACVEKQLGEQIFKVDPSEECNAFLIPDEDITDAREAKRFIEKRWKSIFEQFLFEWFTDESLWPQNRTLKMFREWFELIYAPMAWDLVKQPLEVDEWSELEFDPSSSLH